MAKPETGTADKRITAAEADRMKASFEVRDEMLAELQECCDEGQAPEEAIARVTAVL